MTTCGSLGKGWRHPLDAGGCSTQLSECLRLGMRHHVPELLLYRASGRTPSLSPVSPVPRSGDRLKARPCLVKYRVLSRYHDISYACVRGHASVAREKNDSCACPHSAASYRVVAPSPNTRFYRWSRCGWRASRPGGCFREVKRARRPYPCHGEDHATVSPLYSSNVDGHGR